MEFACYNKFLLAQQHIFGLMPLASVIYADNKTVKAFPLSLKLSLKYFQHENGKSISTPRKRLPFYLKRENGFVTWEALG